MPRQSAERRAHYVIEDCSLMRLRELEVLETVSQKANMTVVGGEKGLADRVVELLCALRATSMAGALAARGMIRSPCRARTRVGCRLVVNESLGVGRLPERTVRNRLRLMAFQVGILGGGNISETHASAASQIEGVEIVAVAGSNAHRVRSLAERHRAAAYADAEALVRHRPLDIVLIGSPSGLHAEQGIAAARQGLHVLVEKPIDVASARAEELIAACAAAGVNLGVFFQDRFAPDFVRLKQALDEGALGRPLLASARVKWWRPAEYYGRSRWRGTRSLDGGGALINQGIHTVDLLLWLLGDVRRVFARTTTALHAIETEDTIVATLEFELGALATFEATTAAYPGYPRQVEVTGTEGTVVLQQDRILQAALRTPRPDLVGSEADANPSASSPAVSDVRGHKAALEDFLRSIREGAAPRCSGREALRSLRLVEALYRSARTQEPVILRPVSS